MIFAEYGSAIRLLVPILSLVGLAGGRAPLKLGPAASGRRGRCGRGPLIGEIDPPGRAREFRTPTRPAAEEHHKQTYAKAS